jgi:hypothetical protein
MRWGRIIAEHKKFKLSYVENPGEVKFSRLQEIFPNVVLIDGEVNTNNVIFFGPDLQYIDLEAAYNHIGGIHLYGYWQKYYYYLPYRDKIREWFKYDDNSYAKPDADDIVIHIRGKYSAGNVVELLVPIPLFVETVKKLDYKNCILVTNEVTPGLLKSFEGVRNVKIQSGTQMEDFTFMKHAKRLIMSQSTFSWWAMFLGNPDKVYVPLSIRNYPCAWKMFPAKEDIDLIPMSDEYIRLRFNG